MQTRTLALLAGIPQADHQGGTTICCYQTMGGEFAITLLDDAGNRLTTINDFNFGMKLQPAKPFGGYELLSAVDSIVTIVVGYGDADMAGAAVLVTNNGTQRIPVDIGGGNVTVNLASPMPTLETLAGTLTDTGLVTATAVRAALLAASPTRRSFRARSAGPDPVAVGGAAVTFATATLILQPGDVWLEADAPGAAWKCICDAGKTASLYVLELT
jgi:hypothetical protein